MSTAPMSRLTDPDTSKAAAFQARDLAAAHADAILRCLLVAEKPLCADEIAARTDLSGVQVSRRLAGLRNAGHIEFDGYGRSLSGRRARAFRAV